ncbi:MAG: DsbA family protein [Candidatus Sungbacteria bacterium]|nr:DsbA family protein [bacterium]MDZ4260506.1 DsbA family protein [Candidatus Sungbacteria bacterium]
MEGNHEHRDYDEPENQEHDIGHSRDDKPEGPGPYVIPFSIVLAGVIIAGAIMFTNSGGSSENGKLSAQVKDTVENKADLTLLPGNGPVLGDPNAPVTIVEFADFQCPFCGRFFKTTGKEVIETYVKTGKAKFIYRDFAFLGEESEWASQAARCAGDQGKYWQYHDYLYEHQNGENEGAFAKAKLKGFAAALGLTASQFNECLDSGKYEADVKSDTEAGRSFGVSGTPSTFVNGKMITGAVPFSEFKTEIEAALNSK